MKPQLLVSLYDHIETAEKTRMFDWIESADIVEKGSIVCDHIEKALPSSEPRNNKYDYSEDALPAEQKHLKLPRHCAITEPAEPPLSRPSMTCASHQPPSLPGYGREFEPNQEVQVSMVIAAAEQLRAAAALRRREQLEHEAQIAQMILDRAQAEEALHAAHAAAIQRYQSQLDLANAELAATRRALVYATTNGMSPYHSSARTPFSSSSLNNSNQTTTPPYTSPSYTTPLQFDKKHSAY